MSITLAQLGWVHEMGNSHVPARPFLIPGLQERRSELQMLTKELLTRVLRGQMTKRAALGQLGATGQTMVQDKLRRGPFKPLSLDTVNRRIKRMTRKQYGSFASSGTGITPLIDTGQMQQNIAWEFDSE